MPQRSGAVASRRSKGRNEYRHRYDGEVFGECDAHHHAPVQRRQLAPFQEEFQQHHRAGHANRRTGNQTLNERPPQELSNWNGQEGDQGNPRRRTQQGNLADPQQLFHRKLNANGEHQQHDADIGEQLKRVRIRERGPWREWTD